MPRGTGCGHLPQPRFVFGRLVMRGLEKAIAEEAQKLIRRFENYARGLADEYQRRCRRTTQSVPRLSLKRPLYWSLADGFDPYIVRARAASIAHAVTAKV